MEVVSQPFCTVSGPLVSFHLLCNQPSLCGHCHRRLRYPLHDYVHGCPFVHFQYSLYAHLLLHCLLLLEGDLLGKPCSGIHDWLSKFLSGSHALAFLFLEGDPMSNFLSGFHALLVKPHSGFHEGDPLAKVLLAIPHGHFYAIRSNQGESSGSGCRAGEERNGGGGGGNQGIGGGVGGGGHREGIGNERRGCRGRSHEGGHGDNDDNDRRGWVGYIVDESRPMGPRRYRMAEILLPFNFQIFATVESLDITGLSVRVRIVRVVSLGFTSVALVCLLASIQQRGTNPRLASILRWIGSVATFLGFISMIAMALLASFIP